MPRRKAKTQGAKPSRDVNAAVKAAAALDLAIAGHDWQTIADLAGYASKGAAYNAVQRELDRTITPKVQELRKLHLLRAKRLRSVYFPKAMAGDGWSFDRVLRLEEREAQLMGLDTKADAGDATQPTIIRETYPSSWVAGLATLAQVADGGGA